LGGTLSLEPSGVAPALGGTLRAVSVSAAWTGTFAAVTDTFDDRRFLPIYLPGSVDLRVVPGSYTQVGLTEDQKAVGGALDKLFDGSDPQGKALIWSLSGLTAEQYPGVLEGMNPSSLSSFFQTLYRVAGFQTAAVEGRAIDLLERRNGFGDRKTLLRYADAGNPSEETALGRTRESRPRVAWGAGRVPRDGRGRPVGRGDESGEGYDVTFQRFYQPLGWTTGCGPISPWV
jgi:hypothetical protein